MSLDVPPRHCTTEPVPKCKKYRTQHILSDFRGCKREEVSSVKYFRGSTQHGIVRVDHDIVIRNTRSLRDKGSSLETITSSRWNGRKGGKDGYTTLMKVLHRAREITPILLYLCTVLDYRSDVSCFDPLKYISLLAYSSFSWSCYLLQCNSHCFAFIQF